MLLFNLEVMSDFLQPHEMQHARISLSTTCRNLFNLMSIESVMPSNHLILCCPLLLFPSTFQHQGLFSNELVPCIRKPKYCTFSFSISPSNEYSGLIHFRIDWFYVLAIQGTLKSLLQHCSLKTSILQHSAWRMWLIRWSICLFVNHFLYLSLEATINEGKTSSLKMIIK